MSRKPYDYVAAAMHAFSEGSGNDMRKVLRKLVRQAVVAGNNDNFDRGDHNGVYEAADRIARELVPAPSKRAKP